MDLRKLLSGVFDWIYPPVCAGCGEPGALLCESCRGNLHTVGEHFCSKCGKPLKKGSRCRLCRTHEFRFLSSRAPYIYDGPAAAMIKSLKYNGNLSLVPLLADLLSEFWMNLNWDIDIVIPVPLSQERRAQRGFNQSEMIAKAFAGRTGLKADPRALMKIRHTAQQVGLSAEQRQENLHNAFAAENILIRGKRILLLDDVMTTGSTFAECSAVLLDGGARSVNCLSIATVSTASGVQNMLNDV